MIHQRFLVFSLLGKSHQERNLPGGKRRRLACIASRLLDMVYGQGKNPLAPLAAAKRGAMVLQVLGRFQTTRQRGVWA